MLVSTRKHLLVKDCVLTHTSCIQCRKRSKKQIISLTHQKVRHSRDITYTSFWICFNEHCSTVAFQNISQLKIWNLQLKSCFQILFFLQFFYTCSRMHSNLTIYQNMPHVSTTNITYVISRHKTYKHKVWTTSREWGWNIFQSFPFSRAEHNRNSTKEDSLGQCAECTLPRGADTLNMISSE